MMVKKSVIHREELSFRLLRTALFLLPPVTAFYLMQFLYGAWPWQTAPGAALANVICVGALYFLMCGLTGTRHSAPASRQTARVRRPLRPAQAHPRSSQISPAISASPTAICQVGR